MIDWLDSNPVAVWGLAAALLVVAVRELVQAIDMRAGYRIFGGGMQDDDSGAGTLAAVPVEFPSELEIAEQTKRHLCVTVFTLNSSAPSAAMRAVVSAMRRYERCYRIDFHQIAAVFSVESKAEAVVAAARTGEQAAQALDGSVEIGSAWVPDDGRDFLDLVHVATTRIAPLARYHAVASEAAGAPVLSAQSE